MTHSNIVLNASFYQNRWKQHEGQVANVFFLQRIFRDVQRRPFFIGEIPFRDGIRFSYNTTYQLLSHLLLCISEHTCSRNIRSLFTTALDLCVAIQNSESYCSGITVFRKYSTNHFPQMFWTRALPFRFLYECANSISFFFLLFSPILDFKIQTIRKRIIEYHT